MHALGCAEFHRLPDFLKFSVWRDGRWELDFGWQSLKFESKLFDSRVGNRLLSIIHVPDHFLFQRIFPDLKTIEFSAGLENKILHLAVWAMSFLVRAGLINDLSEFAEPLKRMSEWKIFALPGSHRGSMFVEMIGMVRKSDNSSVEQRKRVVWQIFADGGDGPQIPISPVLILARAIREGKFSGKSTVGPCIGSFTLEEFVDHVKQFNIQTQTQEID